MSENLLKLASRDITTRHGAVARAIGLLYEIEKHHGEEVAREIFARLGREPTPSEVRERKGFDVLRRFDSMDPRPNVDELARQLAKETGRTFDTAKGYINEWRRKRREMITAGTWQGPPYYGETFTDWGKDDR
jgi:hypothetical protein